MLMVEVLRTGLVLAKGRLAGLLSFFLVFFLAGVMAPTGHTYAATEVTPDIQVNYSGARYDRRSGITSYSVTLTNSGEDAVAVPLKVIIESISSDQVTVGNPDGSTEDGLPYFDYSSLVGDEVLDPGETSAPKTWQFNNPRRLRFSFNLRIEAGENFNPPTIKITNPVDNSVISNANPLITISFFDPDSEIDTESFYVEINGVNATNLFDVTSSGASCQYNQDLPEGTNTIIARINNSHDMPAETSAVFTVSQSNNQNRYIFSVRDNPWLFLSPGDGTYREYLGPQAFGTGQNDDVISFSIDRAGDFYFTLSGAAQILESQGTGTFQQYLPYSQLGILGNDLDAFHILLNGDVVFSLAGEQDIFYSTGDGSNSIFVTNENLGMPDREITGLFIDYDGLINFAVPNASGNGTEFYQSSGDGNNSQFMTETDLGVPGSQIDAFAMVPDTDAPSISITAPADGAFLNTTTPAVSIIFSDDYAGIDTSSFNLAINGNDFTDQCTVTLTGTNCQITNDLPVGSNTAVATISDLAGNEASDSSTFQIGILRAIPGATPVSGPAPLTVHFTTDGEDPAGTIEVFRWDFNGDGTWDTYDTVARDYTRTYNSSGTYNAVLYVQCSTGQTATATLTITVQNNPPVVSADVLPSNGAVPLTVQLHGTAHDVDGQIVLYEWDFDGDGIYDWTSTTTGDTSYTYTTTGTHNAIFRATDNQGASTTASAVTTVITVGTEGSPTAQGSATPNSGPAPLTVHFDGVGTDPDGTVVLYEWDFDGDGIYDWSSDTSAATTHTYSDAGTFAAALRVTDNDGKTGVDHLLIEAGLRVSLTVLDTDKTFNPSSGESIAISASINASVPAFVDIKNSDGTVVKTIPIDTTNGNLIWDGTDNNNLPVTDGLYYAVLRYRYDNAWHVLDVTNTTGGRRYSFPIGRGCNRRSGSWLENFSPFEDQQVGFTFTLCSAQEVTFFIGPLWGGQDQTRVRTILNREAFPAGTHTIYWDGLDDNGNIAQPSPGDSLITGAWRYSLPDNAIYVTGGKPEILNVSADPNYFSPFSEKCDANGNGEGIFIDYTVSEDVAALELRVYSVETGSLLRTMHIGSAEAGAHTIFWDGKNNDDEYVDIGDYRIGIMATDADGNQSIFRYTLVRIDY